MDDAFAPELDPRPLTPREIVSELDRYVVGQREAKRAVAVALRNRWRRQRVPAELRDEIHPKNIILIGPTGVGKSEIARRLARLARAPFLKVEATKFTEVGYVGRDVESMVRDLVELAVELVKGEEAARVAARSREYAEDVLIDLLEELAEPERRPLELDEGDERTAFIVGDDGVVQREEITVDKKDLLRRRLRRGELDEEYVEIEVTESQPLDGSLSSERKAALGSVFEGMGILPKQRKKKRLRVREARRVLCERETDRLIDMDRVVQRALERTEQSGIVFLDEIDKIAGTDSPHGPDVSRQGVQRDLLPIIEGSSVTTKYGVVKTDHVLFIAAGAFHTASPSDLIPEMQGRFPVRVELHSLTQRDFERILTEPRNALTRQYIALLETEGLRITFDDAAVAEIAAIACRANTTLEDIGARRLHTIMELVFDELAFDAPELGLGSFNVTTQYVRGRLDGVLDDDDLSRYIL